MVKKNVLVAVSGLTPQIITETLYCLTQTKKHKSNISEIYAITTATGKKTIINNLLNNGCGYFYSFCKEYNIDHNSIRFNLDTIISVCDKNGNELDDIRTKNDNKLLAQTILSFIKNKTREKNTILHCSVAGGRKTMSLYLGYALQFYGRPNDTLLHVLVSPEFEFVNDFYYKPKKNNCIKAKGKHGEVANVLNTKNAVIELAEIPFVHLRGKFTDFAILEYDNLVTSIQSELDQIPVVGKIKCNLDNLYLMINEKEIMLQPLHFVIYYYFLDCKYSKCRYPRKNNCNDCYGCFRTYNEIKRSAKVLLAFYKRIYGSHSAYYRRLNKRWSKGYIKPHNSLSQYISKINHKIKSIYHDSMLYNNYAISTYGSYGNVKFGIKLDKSKIEIM